MLLILANLPVSYKAFSTFKRKETEGKDRANPHMAWAPVRNPPVKCIQACLRHATNTREVYRGFERKLVIPSAEREYEVFNRPFLPFFGPSTTLGAETNKTKK